MFTSLVLSLSLTSLFDDSYVQRFIDAGFVGILRTRSTSAPFNYDRSLSRESDSSGLMIGMFQHATVRKASSGLKNAAYGAAGYLPSVSFSGVLLGDQVFSHRRDGATVLLARAGVYTSHVKVLYSKTSAEIGRGVRRNANSGADAVLLERFTREKLGRLHGDTFAGAESVTINGTSVRDTARSPDGVIYIRLQPWAQARGIAYTVDADELTADLTVGGATTRLLMLAPQTRRGGTWSDLNGRVYPVLRNGNWYVPYLAFESITR